MEPRFCDWHTHLNFSKDSPLSIKEYFEERLPRVIRDIPLAGVSITDHNTLRAYTVGEAEEYIRSMNNQLDTRVKLLIGTELSLDVMFGEKKDHWHFLFYHPNTKGSLKRTAEWLENGTLGYLMRTIASQNNERHRLMAEKAARYLNLIPGDTQALNSIIEMEREPSPETGREHIKKALTILFPHLKNRVQDMFSSSCDDERSSCYVANEEVNGFDVPYIRVLEELKREYPKGIVLLAHPWRYDSEFRFANKPKAAQGRLRDMSEFVPELARQDLIRGLEIYGYYLIPKHLRDMDLQDLIENHVPGNVQHSVRCPLKLDKDTGKEYTIKHLRYIGTRYRLIAERVNEARKREGGRLSEIRFLCAGGNDSHGEELPGGKPDIPIGYGCRETDPLPFDMTGIRHTPARPIPAIGSLSR